MLTDKQRTAIVAEAKSWVKAKTPYRGWSCVKGKGTDCGQLIYGVFRALNLIPAFELPKDYSLQVARHRVSTEYVELVERFFRPIPEEEVKPGDVVVYKIGLAYAHAALVIEWPNYVVQAELRHGVSMSHGRNNPALRERQYLRGTVCAFYTLRDEYGVSQ